MPPSEPPITSFTLLTPSATARRCCTRTMSRTVTSGKRPCQGLPVAGSISAGPVEP